MSRPRMHHQTRRLVEDGEMVVLEDEMQIGLGGGVGTGGRFLGQEDRQLGSALEQGRGPQGFAGWR